MAKRKSNNNHAVLSIKVGEQLSKYSGASNKSEEEKGSLVQLALEDGFNKSSQWRSPKSKGSTCTEELWASMRDYAYQGFSAKIKKILNTDKSKLEKADFDKDRSKYDMTTGNKRYWQQQIGTKIGDVARALAKLEKPKGNGKGKGKGNKSTEPKLTFRQDIEKRLDEVVAMLESADSKVFKSAFDLKVYLKHLSVRPDWQTK